MKNKSVIVIFIILLVLVVITGVIITGVVVFNSSKNESNLTSVTLNSNGKIKKFINQVYDQIPKDDMMSVESVNIDLNDEYALNSYLGLQDKDKIQCAVASEPLMTSSAYSFVVASLKDGSNAQEVANEILNGVNPRKWICVEAEQTNVIFKDNVVVLVMTDKDLATSITNAVKTKLNVTDANVLEKENVDGDYELPPEMIVTQ